MGDTGASGHLGLRGEPQPRCGPSRTRRGSSESVLQSVWLTQAPGASGDASRIWVFPGHPQSLAQTFPVPGSAPGREVASGRWQVSGPLASVYKTVLSRN